MQPTPQQQAVYDAVADTPDHLAIAAVAGSGKSSSIIEASKLAGQNVVFLAFNKAIVEELRAKIPPAVDVRTNHSLGLRILKGKWRSANVDFDRRKDWELAEREASDLFSEPDGRMKSTAEVNVLMELIDKIKNSLLFNLTPQEIASRCADSFEDSDANPEWMSAKALQLACMSVEDMTSITGADMIAGPTYHGMVRPIYETAFYDEAQDASEAQKQLVLNSADRIIFVGDRRQAIMQFCGAGSRSFDAIIEALSDDHRPIRELPLSVCFRCPLAHAALARSIEPKFSSPEWAKEGSIHDTPPERLAEVAKDGALVICRTNAPLIGMAFQLIKKNRKALVRGRAIGAGLIALCNKWKTDSSSLFMQRMDTWLKREFAKLDMLKGEQKPARQNLQDRYDCMKFFADADPTVTGMRTRIEALFSDITPANSVVLSSIHRSKGLQSDQIFWVDTAKMASATGQEANLVYVALTRSKSELHMTGTQPLAAADLPAFARAIGGN